MQQGPACKDGARSCSLLQLVWLRPKVKQIQSAVRCCRVLRGHRGSVLALLALGSLLISGGRSGLLRVWDLEALVCRRTLTGHHADVLSMAALVPSDCGGQPQAASDTSAAPLVCPDLNSHPIRAPCVICI